MRGQWVNGRNRGERAAERDCGDCSGRAAADLDVGDELVADELRTNE
jgi:hypothetical protein